MNCENLHKKRTIRNDFFYQANKKNVCKTDIGKDLPHHEFFWPSEKG